MGRRFLIAVALALCVAAAGQTWIRWKAVRGIAALGVTTSRGLIDDCASDPDFRVRLEATRALAGGAT